MAKHTFVGACLFIVFAAVLPADEAHFLPDLPAERDRHTPENGDIGRGSGSMGTLIVRDGGVPDLGPNAIWLGITGGDADVLIDGGTVSPA